MRYLLKTRPVFCGLFVSVFVVAIALLLAQAIFESIRLHQFEHTYQSTVLQGSLTGLAACMAALLALIFAPRRVAIFAMVVSGLLMGPFALLLLVSSGSPGGGKTSILQALVPMFALVPAFVSPYSIYVAWNEWPQ